MKYLAGLQGDSMGLRMKQRLSGGESRSCHGHAYIRTTVGFLARYVVFLMAKTCSSKLSIVSPRSFRARIQ